ncbi:MAG: phage terminase large subunit [Chloroflexota bacterium]
MEIVLPPMHVGQLEVFNDPARFKVVCCGRQWGKTTLGAVECVDVAARGGSVWWVAPSFPVGELGWIVIEALCRQIPGARFEGRPVWRVTLPTGGTIQLRSADNPDSLRGATLDHVVFDEAAMAKQGAWPVLRPTLAIRGGTATFISTPKGLNWFNDLFEDAERRSLWARWRFPSTSNPHLPDEEVEKAKAEMSSFIFAQEYLAEFVSASSGLFRAEWFKYWHTPEGSPEIYAVGDNWVPKAKCRVFSTVDLAWSQDEDADFTVISTWAMTPERQLLLLDVTRGHYEAHQMGPILQGVYERHRPAYMVVERTTKQLAIVADLEATGLPIREVRPDKDKISRALPAVARMESGNVWFPARSDWMRDLEEEVLAFPLGRHDDFVDTLAYAVLQIAKRSVYEDRGPEFV